MAASGLSKGLIGSLPPLFDISRGGIDSAPADAIRFSTVASFKGLEADIVLLLDVDDLESVGALSSIYVGASRAKVLLVLFLDEGVRSALSEQARRFGAAAFRKDGAAPS
jgi:superfamily I DNA/RNA helicase